MLNLDHKSTRSFDIRYMLLMRPVIYVHHFLAIDRKGVFPVSVPVSFRFVPRVAGDPGLVSPMPPNVLTALGNHVIATETAFAPQIWCRLGTNLVDERESHIYLTFCRLGFLADNRDTKGVRMFSYKANRCSTRSRSEAKPVRR